MMKKGVSKDEQLHAGSWHTITKADGQVVYWSGDWHYRTPQELYAECRKTMNELRRNHPDLFPARKITDGELQNLRIMYSDLLEGVAFDQVFDNLLRIKGCLRWEHDRDAAIIETQIVELTSNTPPWMIRCLKELLLPSVFEKVVVEEVLTISDVYLNFGGRIKSFCEMCDQLEIDPKDLL